MQFPGPSQRYRIISIISVNRRFMIMAQVCWTVFWLASAALAAPQATAGGTCFRPTAGSEVLNPPELRSQDGVLEVTLRFRFRQTVTGEGPVRYCYQTDLGQVAPTLRVRPGDRLLIHFVNEAAAGKYAPLRSASIRDKSDCSDSKMEFFTTNLHFHGMRVPPLCHQDDVLHTFIQPGEKFDYDVRIPANQPPGLYWYHPHMHSITERQVQGGASGALIVEGIDKQHPSVTGLPQRVFVIRDQQLMLPLDSAAPTWDLSINYVPVTYPNLVPATLSAGAHQKEFWRVVNAAADTILDLQVLKAGQPQKLQLVALDGVAIRPATPQVDSIPLPPGSRAEFVVETPNDGEQLELITRDWDTGPLGDRDPRRTLLQISVGNDTESTPLISRSLATKSGSSGEVPWKGPTLERKLYFSEESPNPLDPDISTFFFVTVLGQEPELYKMDSPPNIVLHQGAVEEWIVENRSEEDHVFHIHQLHFQVLAIDGKPVHDAEMRDTINVPYWKGEGPYPSVRLLMDFRSPSTVGTFPYHCHIEKHADMGMMGTVEVLPPGVKTSVGLNFSPLKPESSAVVKFTATVVPEKSGGSPLSGKVQLNVDGRNLDKLVSLSGGQAQLEASFFEKGEHVVKAMYWGDPLHGESASPAAIVKVR